MGVSLILFFSAGYILRPVIEAPKRKHGQIRRYDYQYINPLLDCELGQKLSPDTHPQLRPVRERVNNVIREHIADTSAQAVFVYFRDLSSSSWFGINEQQMFPPASMMKVPLMIAILKRAEHDPGLLQRKIPYLSGREAYRTQHFKPVRVLRRGSSYTVEDLISRMIVDSDNDSSLLLAEHFGMAAVDDSLAELGISVKTGGPADYMNLRNYSALFRILFNASYLSNDMSEKALGYLARSTFARGLRAALPRGTLVASKFGEHCSGPLHLNECGIVYYRDHPYLLGVATQGGTPESLAHVIEEISKAVYQDLERQHGLHMHGE